MEMKQRIIGLVVLVALGVILVPLIFDSETVLKPDAVTAAAAQATTNKTLPHSIQPGQIEASADKILDHQPPMTAFAQTEPQDFEDRDEEESTVADLRDKTADNENEPLEREAPVKLTSAKSAVQKAAVLKSTTGHDESLAPVVWAIQLGVFSEAANANKLVAELKSKGFHAFVAHDNNQKNVHRVLIGPEKDRAVADETVAQLASEHHINSIVVRYKR